MASLSHGCGAIRILGDNRMGVGYDMALGGQLIKRLLPFIRFRFCVEDNNQHSVHGWIVPFDLAIAAS
jgi:hypothetical protein